MSFATVLGCASGAIADDAAGGIRLYNQHRYQEAADSLQKAVGQDQNNVQAWYYLASSMYALRRTNDAIELYWAIVRHFPKARESYTARTFLKSIDPEYAAHEAARRNANSIKATVHQDPSHSYEVTSLDSSAKQAVIDKIVTTVRAQAGRPEVTSDLVEKIKSALLSYPTNLLALIAMKGCKIYLTPTMIELPPN
jgi:tetratricopeptide (TPR) repeat protein